jgi:hypothetical protein
VRARTRTTVRLEHPGERIADFVPLAPPATAIQPYPIARSRTITRELERAELEAVRCCDLAEAGL